MSIKKYFSFALLLLSSSCIFAAQKSAEKKPASWPKLFTHRKSPLVHNTSFPEESNVAGKSDKSLAQSRAMSGVEGSDLEHLKELELYSFNLLREAIFKNDSTHLTELLDADVNANVTGLNGVTPLLLATQRDDVTCMEILLARGADVYKKISYKNYGKITIFDLVQKKAYWAKDWALKNKKEDSSREATLERIRILTPHVARIKLIQKYEIKTEEQLQVEELMKATRTLREEKRIQADLEEEEEVVRKVDKKGGVMAAFKERWGHLLS